MNRRIVMIFRLVNKIFISSPKILMRLQTKSILQENSIKLQSNIKGSYHYNKCNIKEMCFCDIFALFYSYCVFQIKIILFCEMIDRVLNFGPVQQESYYFQLIPLSLSMINPSSQLPAKGTTYRFSVSKGQQKFDESKIPIEANFQTVGKVPVIVINSIRLNFYLPNYSKQRRQDFMLNMVQRQNNEDFELGEFRINTEELVTAFKDGNTVRHQLKTQFSDDYELDFEIYIEKNRMALEKNIRENKTERINKSPLRKRKEDSNEESPKRSLAKSPKTSNITPSRDREENNSVPTETEGKVENGTDVVVENVERSFQKKQLDRSYKQQAKAEEAEAETERPETAFRDTRQSREKSAKEEVQSRKSTPHVPLLATKARQLAKQDTPSEVKLQNSQRLGGASSEAATSSKPAAQGEIKEKVTLTIFFLLSFYIMYLSMFPNRKV